LRQYGRHAERYRFARARLKDIQIRMRSTHDPRYVRSDAARAYKVMVDENLDWFGVVEFENLGIVI
jgi:hypothetical protein